MTFFEGDPNLNGNNSQDTQVETETFTLSTANETENSGIDADRKFEVLPDIVRLGRALGWNSEV